MRLLDQPDDLRLVALALTPKVDVRAAVFDDDDRVLERPAFGSTRILRS